MNTKYPSIYSDFFSFCTSFSVFTYRISYFGGLRWHLWIFLKQCTQVVLKLNFISIVHLIHRKAMTFALMLHPGYYLLALSRGLFVVGWEKNSLLLYISAFLVGSQWGLFSTRKWVVLLHCGGFLVAEHSLKAGLLLCNYSTCLVAAMPGSWSTGPEAGTQACQGSMVYMGLPRLWIEPVSLITVRGHQGSPSRASFWSILWIFLYRWLLICKDSGTSCTTVLLHCWFNFQDNLENKSLYLTPHLVEGKLASWFALSKARKAWHGWTEYTQVCLYPCLWFRHPTIVSCSKYLRALKVKCP